MQIDAFYKLQAITEMETAARRQHDDNLSDSSDEEDTGAFPDLFSHGNDITLIKRMQTVWMTHKPLAQIVSDT